MLVGDVVGLGEVVLEVEQRPAVGGEVATALQQALLVDHALGHVVGGRLPTVRVDGARAEHLEVLHVARVGRVGIVERRSDRRAIPPLLHDAVDLLRRSDAHEVEHRGREVDGVDELVAHLTARGEPGGVVHDQRGPAPTEPRVALPESQRSVAGPRPPPRVVRIRADPTEIVVVRGVAGDGVGDVLREPVLVERPDGAPLGAGAVVGHEHDDGVVEHAEPCELVDDATDLGVGVGEEAGEDLHLPTHGPALVGGQRLPVGDPLGPLGELGLLGHDAEGVLSLVHLVTPLVPAAVETTAVEVAPLR